MCKAENIDSERDGAGGIDLSASFVRALETLFENTVHEYHDAAVPAFDESKSALFSYRNQEADSLPNESALQDKVANDFHQLWAMGYDTMIVNVGTRYGMLALKELADHKRKGCAFRLIGAKIRGELPEEPNLQAALLLAECESIIYTDNGEQYNDIVSSQVSFLSDESGLTKL